MSSEYTHTSYGERWDNGLSAAERGFLTDNFDTDLRVRQMELFQDIDPYDDEAMELATIEAEWMTYDYITELGVNEDDDLHRDLYFAARRYSYDVMDDAEWFHGNPDDTNDQGGYLRLHDEQAAIFERPLLPDGSGYADTDLGYDENYEENDTPEHEWTLEQIEDEIDHVSDEMAVAFADRMKVGYFSFKKKAQLQQELEAKQAELDALYAERNYLLEDEWASTKTPEEMAEEMADILEEDTDVENDGERRAMHTRTIGARALSAYANLSLGEKMFVGGVATGFTAIYSLAVAGSAGSVGVLTLGGVRLVRAYSTQRSKIYQTPDRPGPINPYHEDNTPKTIEELTIEARERRMMISSDRIEKADKVKKWCGVATLGSAALIGVGAATEHIEVLHNVADKVKSGIGRVWEFVHGPKVGATEVPTNIPRPPSPAPPLPSRPPEIPTPTPSSGFDIAQFQDAATITDAEGLQSTMQQLDIDPNDWNRLLHDDALMQRLNDMGMVYRDGRAGVGEWGLRMTEDGKVSPEALKSLYDAAHSLAR